MQNTLGQAPLFLDLALCEQIDAMSLFDDERTRFSMRMHPGLSSSDALE